METGFLVTVVTSNIKENFPDDQMIRRLMTDTTNGQEPERKPPVYGALSLAMPLFGVPFAFGIGKSYHGDSWGWGGLIIFVLLGFGAILSGLLAALAGLGRSEKYSILSVLGLFLNGGILLWLFSGRH